MKILFFILVANQLFISLNLAAQVGINTTGNQPDPSAGLDINFNNKGVLVPRMTQSQISDISHPADGLIVFCTTDDKLYLFVASANIWKEISYGTGTIATFPFVTTADVTDITQTTATSGGTITSDGGATVTSRGVCWSTGANPTTVDSHTTDGTGIGAFGSNLTGLAANTLYYVRAYATNSVGISYGNQVSFTTLSFTIGLSYGGGIIFYIDSTGQQGLIAAPSDQGTQPWGCIGTLIGGTATAIGTGQANTSAIVNGCSQTSIAARICDTLTLNGYTDWYLPSKDELYQMYIHRTEIGGFAPYTYWSSSEYDDSIAWCQGWDWGIQYNNVNKGYNFFLRAIRTFPPLPTITTTDITNITQTTATSGGNVISDGGSSVTVRGVCWNTSTNPTTANSHTTDGTGTGEFVSNLTGLLANTLYYVRAYATNSVGISYGNQVSFTTLSFTIGLSYGGGIIFYLNSTGQHGLIAAPSDQEILPWGCIGTLIGGTGTAIGTGQANTTAIVNGCSQTGIAARICDNLELNGYSDWFLPSRDELNLLNQQKGVVGGFAPQVYWSSSEYDDTHAWYQHFVWDYEDYWSIDKSYTICYVRAIRAF